MAAHSPLFFVGVKKKLLSNQRKPFWAKVENQSSTCKKSPAFYAISPEVNLLYVFSFFYPGSGHQQFQH